MVLITDKFHKASNGTRAEATTLTAQKALAASSISTAALNGWPTDTPVNFQLYTTDTQNNIVPGSQSDWVGIVSGTTITQLQLTGGSDSIYPIGTIVVCLPTSDWADSLVEGLLVSHDQDGTLIAGAVDNAAVLASNVVTTAKILDANVTTAKLASAAVTTDKQKKTSWFGFMTATTLTSSVSTVATQVIPATTNAHTYLITANFEFNNQGNATGGDFVGIIADGTTVLSQSVWTSPNSSFFNTIPVQFQVSTATSVTINFRASKSGVNQPVTARSSWSIVDLGQS